MVWLLLGVAAHELLQWEENISNISSFARSLLDKSIERFQDINKPSSHFLVVLPSIVSIYVKSVRLLEASGASLRLPEGPLSGFVLVKVRTLAWTFQTVGRRPRAQTDSLTSLRSFSGPSGLLHSSEATWGSEAAASALPFMSLIAASLSSAALLGCSEGGVQSASRISPQLLLVHIQILKK